MKKTENPFPLHALMRRGNELVGAGWAGRAKILLDEGFVADELDDHDMTPLMILADSGVSNDDAGKMAVLLVARGANPLCKDRAISRVMHDAVIGGDQRMSQMLIDALLATETSERKLRSETGENLLHVLAADCPQCLCMVLRQARNSNAKEIIANWLNEPDDNGRLPLHAMWDEYGVIWMRLDEDMDVDEHLDALEATEEMVAMGADMLARSRDDRKPVVNMIVDCVNKGFPIEGYEDAWARVEALATNIDLEANTPDARGHTNKGVRL